MKAFPAIKWRLGISFAACRDWLGRNGFSSSETMGLYPKAIMIGIITDFVLSVLGALVLSGFGVDANNPYSPAFSLILGLAAVAVGGYVVARLSQSSKVLNAAVFGGAELLLGLLIAVAVAMPLWFEVASFSLIIPAALMGAYIALPTAKH